ncbi:DUF4855 domain-containing protein [Brevibacillus reuszeri]|uniref:DUF4855 domain-containing protein n=1 Tax=Brevibacillus reuszeri TaxID=54915 RepID=UPI003D25A35D
MSKKRFGSRMLAACLAVTTLLVQTAPLASASTDPEKQTTEKPQPEKQTVMFSDIENSYARNAVNRLVGLHLINGQGNDRFNPHNSISRQDIAVLLTKVMGLQPKSVEDARFEDVPLNSPYASYVYGLQEMKVMNGRNDQTLGSTDPLTRQELAVMLSRLMKAGGVKKTATTNELAYSDEDEIADYAKEAIHEVTNQRWMQGNGGKFNPAGIVTRADAVVIAERILDARYQQAEQANFTVNTQVLSLLAGTSERVRVTGVNGEMLPFTPIFAFDRPELGTVLADGTFVAGPTPGKGNITVTMGYKTVMIPVEIKNEEKPPAQVEEKGAGTADSTASTPAAQDNKAKAGDSDQKTDPAAAGEMKDPSAPVESTDPSEPAEQEELINVAPGSFTSVDTFGQPDSYFREIEKQYPGPVGGLVTPSQDWTGYNRQFGRKVTVALAEEKPLEKVTLTFKHQKSSGITIPEYMDVEVSRDGKAWSYAGRSLHDVAQSEAKIVERTLTVMLPDVETRYVRVSFPVKVFTFARQLEVWAKSSNHWEGGPVLLPPPSPTQLMEDKKAGNRVENMLLAYSGSYGDRGTWSMEDFLPMVGYRTADGYMRDQMFDTILFLPYQNMPVTKDGWQSYMNDLFGSGKQLDALNKAMREYNRLRGTLYTTPTQENVVLALPYPNANQTNFGKMASDKPSLSFSAATIGEEQAYLNRKQALEWYFQELQKRWNKEGYAYLKLEGIYWFHELIDDSAPKERELIRSTASMVHDNALRFYWIPYFGAPGVEEWKSLYFDYAFLQPNYYNDKPVGLDRIEGVLEVVSKYGMGVEIEGDERMYKDPKFYQIYYNQLVAARRLGMDKNNVHAYYYGSKTLIEAANNKDSVMRAIYDDTYKWMRGRFDREEYFEANEMP